MKAELFFTIIVILLMAFAAWLFDSTATKYPLDDALRADGSHFWDGAPHYDSQAEQPLYFGKP